MSADHGAGPSGGSPVTLTPGRLTLADLHSQWRGA